MRQPIFVLTEPKIGSKGSFWRAFHPTTGSDPGLRPGQAFSDCALIETPRIFPVGASYRDAGPVLAENDPARQMIAYHASGTCQFSCHQSATARNIGSDDWLGWYLVREIVQDIFCIGRPFSFVLDVPSPSWR